jgi:hypothetical protein
MSIINTFRLRSEPVLDKQTAGLARSDVNELQYTVIDTASEGRTGRLFPDLPVVCIIDECVYTKNLKTERL